ncbi:MAG: glycosyltransferase [Bacilli bacterium]|nr:glycosyltransferase [Bacilli bacterium]
MIKISVILPLFNQEKYIKRCLLSVVSQSFSNIEIIVVNDGSTDNSVKIVKQIAKRDKRIKLINKKNTGYGNSMNVGLRAAKGEYIGIVETDDFIDKNMYKTLYSLSLNGEADIVKGNFWNYYEEKDGKSNEFSNVERNDVPIIFPYFSVKDHPEILFGHPSVWSAIYKRKFLQDNKIVFKEEKGGGWVDNPFFFETLCLAKKVVYTNKPLYHYRKNPETSSSSGIVNPNTPFNRMNDNLNILQKYHLTDDYTNKFVYSRALQYVYGSLMECDYDSNYALIDSKAQSMLRRLNPDIFRKYFNNKDVNFYYEFTSPIKTIIDGFPKILIYNWLPYDNPFGYGGGVSIYCNNLVNSLIKECPNIQIFFLSSGFAYDATTKNTFVRLLNSSHYGLVKQYEVVNSPIPADQRFLYRNPLAALRCERLKSVFNDFIKKHGPFKAIHFNNIEGLSFDIFDLKKDYPKTKFVYSMHNYIPFCVTNSYYMRHKHCICSPKHSALDCFKCSRVDIFEDLDNMMYDRGKFGYHTERFIPKEEWIKSLHLNLLSTNVKQQNMLKFSQSCVKKLNDNFDHILAVSKRTKDIAISQGISRKKIKLSYIGTHVAECQRLSSAPVNDYFKVVFLGDNYFYEEKGYPFLMKSLSNLDWRHARKIDVVLTTRSNVSKQIKHELHSFHKVTVINGYTHDDLRDILKDCNLSIIPVMWEDNLPQIAVESIAYGVPVLSSSFGGASELCSSPLFKFKGGDETDFLSKLKHLIDNPNDLEQFWKYHNGLKTMKDNVRELIEIYGIQPTNKIVINNCDFSYLLQQYQFLSHLPPTEIRTTVRLTPAMSFYAKHRKAIDKALPHGSTRRAIISKLIKKHM